MLVSSYLRSVITHIGKKWRGISNLLSGLGVSNLMFGMTTLFSKETTALMILVRVAAPSLCPIFGLTCEPPDPRVQLLAMTTLAGDVHQKKRHPPPEDKTKEKHTAPI